LPSPEVITIGHRLSPSLVFTRPSDLCGAGLTMAVVLRANNYFNWCRVKYLRRRPFVTGERLL